MPRAVAGKPAVDDKHTVSKVLFEMPIGGELLRPDFKIPKGPIESIPEPLRELHRNRKILVVDDFKPTLEHIRSKIGDYYPGQLGNTIEIESNPLEAVKKIVQASREGRPYDVLVLDLFMKDYSGKEPHGINGDELLRQIASQNAFVPTVVNSGSWANEIKVGLFHQLESVRTREEFATAMGKVEQQLDGIPITFRHKHSGENATRELVLAMDAVMSIGRRVEQDRLPKYLADLKPEVVEVDTRSMYLSKLVEVTRLYREEGREFLARIIRDFPEYRETRQHTDFTKFISGDFEWEEGKGKSIWDNATYRKFSDPEGGRPTIHSFEAYLRWWALDLYPSRSDSIYAGDDRLVELLSNPAFSSEIKGTSEEFMELFRQFMTYNDAYKIPTTSDYPVHHLFNNLIRSGSYCGLCPEIEKVRVVVREGDSLRYVKSDTDFKTSTRLLDDNRTVVISTTPLIDEILTEVTRNAIKAVRNQEDGLVELSAEKIRVRDIGEKQREYFHGMGLMDDDYVGAVVVKDNGPGIPPENMEKIFEDGFSTFGTSGWGLSFLKKNIGRLNGTYDIKSEVGKGTTFCMYFKLAEKTE